MTIFTADDLAFSRDSKGIIRAGGFKIKTIFGNISPIMSIPGQMGSNDTILDNLAGDLAVPAGLLYLNTISPHQNILPSAVSNDEVAPNQLIDRLVDLMSPTDEKKLKMTRKMSHKKSTHKKSTHKKSTHKKSMHKKSTHNPQYKKTMQTKKQSTHVSRKQTRKSNTQNN